MNDRFDPGMLKRLSVFASGAALLSLGIGLSVLAGWTLQIAALIDWGTGTAMAPNAAACFVLGGLSLWLLREKDNRSLAPPARPIAKVSAAVVSLIGLLSLAEYFFTLDFGIDRLLLLRPPEGQIAAARILMSPVTAGAFLLLGLALAGIDWRTRREDWPAQFLCLGAALAPAFGLVGLFLGPGVFSIIVPLPSVAGFFLLTAGLLCSRATWALGGLLAGRSPGARLLRRAIPAALLILLGIGYLISKPLLNGARFTWIEVCVLAVFSISMLAGFIAWMALIVDRSDAERGKVEQALHISREQLDRLLDRIEEPQSEAQLRRRASGTFMVAIFLTGVLGFLSWRTVQQAAADAAWVSHTHEVSTTLELILTHLVDVETGARGFVLTRREPFLEPYESGRHAVGQDLQALRSFIADPDLKRRFDVLEEQANACLQAAKDLVALRQNSGTAPADAQAARGKQLMDRARATIAEMEDRQRRLLEQRTRRAGAARHFAGAVIILGSLLGVVFLSIAGITVSREIGVSARARAQIKALNADLEQRVVERTAALQSEVAARMEAQAAVGESEGRLAGVIASAMDAIVTVDDQQSIVLFNRAAEEMFRCPESEAIGQPITRFIPQRFHAAHAGHIRRFGETGVTNRAMGPKGVLWALRTDGQEFQIEASISQVVTGGKKLFTVILRDVTERVQAERAVREAQDRMAGIIASAMDAIITVNSQQRIVLFNAASVRIFRCSEAEALGQPIEHFIPRRFRSAHSAHIRQFGETGTTNRAMGQLGALWALRADGEEFQIEASISQIEIAGEKMFTVILRDVTERKRAEEIRDRLAAVVDSSDDAIISKTLDGIIAAWNRGAEKVFGYSASEVAGKPVQILMPPDRVNEESDILARIRRGESVEHFETVRVRKDGKEIDVSVTISPIRDSSGVIVGASKIARDITERKRAEEALRESEERFQAMANGIPQLAWMAEADGSIFWYNQRWYEYTGTTFEQMQGWGWQRVHDPEILPQVMEGWKGAIATGHPFEMEFPLRGADGLFHTFLTRVMPLKDPAGRVVRWFGTNTDISERKQAEERLAAQAVELRCSQQALEAQTLMLQSVLDSISDGLVVADEQGQFTIWNPAARRIVALGPADLPGEEWSAHYGVYLPDGVTPMPGEQNPLLRAIHGEASTTEMFLRHEGLSQGVWIEANGSPLKDKEGVARGGVVAFRDITQRKAYEHEIQELNRDLEERVIERTTELKSANRELEAFTYSVSHDLRAPLRHISGFTKIVVEKFRSSLPAEAQEYLQLVEQGAKKMGQMVDELLSLARVGRQMLAVEVTGLGSLVEDVVTLLAPESEGRQVEWKIGELPLVECDSILVRQVFQNLISNALKYSRPRSPAVIEIGETETEGGKAIFVKDNGVGFEMKYADKLFGVFQRMHREEEFEGIGIGLATVARIIQKHGGRIWAEAELDRGATFYFTLGGREHSVPETAAAATGDSR